MDSVKKDVTGKCGAEPSRPAAPGRLDLAAVRDRLKESRGPEFWRSLDELGETAEFQELLHREFPRHAAEWPEDPSGVSRRGFLQLASASLALAGLTACTRQPLEKIVPYVQQPEQIVPGRPLYFATALTVSGHALGVLAESHTGRPTKIEGNPDHPASLGATDVFAQAAVLDLYDPERSQSISHDGRLGTWSGFLSAITAEMRAKQALGGDGLRILTGAVTSPTLAAQMAELQKKMPKARWHRWEPALAHGARGGASRAFGAPLTARYDFKQARVVVTLDADVLTQGPGAVRYSRDFAAGRQVRVKNPEMTRLYSIESSPTSTGTLADHRLPLPPAEVEAFLAALAQQVGVAGVSGAVLADATANRWLPVVAADLKANPGASLVVVGDQASPAAHVLAAAVNQALGNAGKTVVYTQPAEADPVDHLQSIRELVADMQAGKVDLLLILDSNPVYTAPADLEMARALGKVALRIHHGLFADETAEYCHWHLPAAHELESWGDARAFDGTASVQQPLIEPLYGGKTGNEVLAVFLGHTDATGYELVRATWTGKLPAGDFEAAWRKVVHDGVIPGTELPAVAAAVAGAAVAQAATEIAAAAAQARGKLTLVFRPDATVYDGRFATNAWLQELPKPFTKLTWDNALLVSPATAQRLKLELQDKVELTVDGRKVQAAVWVQPGQAPDTLTLSLGYGRTRAGNKATGQGWNAYAVRTSQALWTAPGATVRALGETYVLASTQNHHLLESGSEEIPLAGREAKARHVVRTGTLEEFKKNPKFVHEEVEAPDRETMTYFPARQYTGHAWGMAIDMNACTGCSACVVACQAENNIPVVGKEQVLKRRVMHWIRIDQYYEGDWDAPRIYNQPLPCQQCENAPCEVVCPVAATSHSDEGLNDMVYNRCVGTRYCSNNCPYKVRRFNFLRYSERLSPVLAMLQNPDVTVRMRGVMEKCTYCVQRIEHAKIDSKVTGEPIAEPRLKTACQQACPTGAIVFGDINQPGWQVAQAKREPHNYGLLEELNTRPRTTYLARLRNENPALATKEENQNGHA